MCPIDGVRLQCLLQRYYVSSGYERGQRGLIKTSFPDLVILVQILPVTTE